MRPTKLCLCGVLCAGIAVGAVAGVALAPSEALVLEQAHAKLVKKSGWYEGGGNTLGIYQTISRIYIKGSKLYVTGKLKRTRRVHGVEKRDVLKRGKYTFKLAKNCRFGHTESENFYAVSKRRYKKQLERAGKMVPLGIAIYVKNGRVFKVNEHS